MFFGQFVVATEVKFRRFARNSTAILTHTGTADELTHPTDICYLRTGYGLCAAVTASDA